jgi:hypothetical protein
VRGGVERQRVSEEADREAIEHLIGTFEVECDGVT